MVALFWNRQKAEADKIEMAEYAEWIKKIREPDVDNNSIRRLESEIHAKHKEILDAFAQRFISPRRRRMTDIRREIDTLKGMVFAWLYVSGKWDIISTIGSVSKPVNDLAMLHLDIDLANLLNRAYPQKAPRDV